MAFPEQGKKYFFDIIFENKNDLVGMMAYTLYKRNKVDFIKDFKKKNNNQEPTKAVLDQWQENECIESKIEQYKDHAQELVTQFMNQLETNKTNEINNKIRELKNQETRLKDRETEIKRKEKDVKSRDSYCHVKNKCPFAMGVLQSLVASFIFILLCYFLCMYLSSNTDLMNALRKPIHNCAVEQIDSSIQ